MPRVSGGPVAGFLYPSKKSVSKSKMKDSKEFISSPLLIAMLAAALIVGSAILIKDRQDEKIEEDKIAQEKEERSRALFEDQQRSLEEARMEIEKLKVQSELSKSQQKALETKLTQGTPKTKDLTIAAADITPYLTGVVEIECKDGRGSGSLWNFKGFGFTVLTNKHVVAMPHNNGACTVDAKNPEKLMDTVGLYNIYPAEERSWNNKTDVSVMELKWAEIEFCDANGLNCTDRSKERFKPIEGLNYSLSALPQCPTKMPIGAPVVVVGFPAFAEQSFRTKNFGDVNLLTTSNGIISAQDDTVSFPVGDLPYPNYFVSAKIDSGNSGGIALSKTQQGLCVLGIPTWVSVGNYETNGVIQNIHNIFYAP